MKTKQLAVVFPFLFSTVFLFSQAQADEMRDMLIGRQGNCSHDDRSRDLLGCWGNTFEAAVSITNVKVSGQKVTVTYNGKYNRDKFDRPCVKTANEQKHVFGTYQFQLKPGRIVWGSPANFGEVSDLKEGFSKSFQRGIQSLEFDSCQVSAELPADPFPMLIAFGLPSIDLPLQGSNIWHPAIQALCTKRVA